MPEFAINKITLNELSYEQAVEACARHGFAGITPWLDDLKHLTPAQARKVADDAGVSIAGFCNAGLFALHGKGGMDNAVDAARHSIDYAAEFGATTIVTVVGGLLPDSKSIPDARKFAFDGMVRIAEHASNTPVRLALEPLHPMYTPDWSMVGSLSDANDWCDRLDNGVGLTVDAYHVWWDPDFEVEIARAASAGRLLSFHISDWLVPTGHMLLDRGMPGDGVIDLTAMWQTMTNAGYGDYIEVEIFSERLWKQDPDAFLAELKNRCNIAFPA